MRPRITIAGIAVLAIVATIGVGLAANAAPGKVARSSEDDAERRSAISEIVSDAPIAQQKALADSHITTEEYTAAVDQEVSCFQSGSPTPVKVFGPNWSPGRTVLDWTYRVEGLKADADARAAQIGDLAKSCALSESAAIRNAWAVEHAPSSDERAQMIKSLGDCVRSLGVKAPQDAAISDLMMALTADTSKAAKDCVARHELLAFGFPGQTGTGN